MVIPEETGKMDAMIDLETWGTRPGCAIRSVGVVTFDLWRPSDSVEQFYKNISDSHCEAAGLKKEQGTVDWWARQSPQAQTALLLDQRPLLDVVQQLEMFLSRHHVKCIWSQGANFDVVLWEVACRAVGREAPWRFFNCRDTRTLYDAAGLDPRSVTRAGTYHNALDDAEHQVECVRRAWAMLNDAEWMKSRTVKVLGPRPGGERIVATSPALGASYGTK